MRAVLGIATGIAAAMLTIAAGGASAHHSYTGFDLNKDVTVKGTVKAFAWEDPHSTIELLVVGPDGKTVEWMVEGAGPRRLTSRGWTVDAVKVGDHAEIVLNPSRDGARVGRMVAVYVDGKRVGREGRE